MRRFLEICVTDFTSARNAALGGADRVELCADMASGGITPSAGLIHKVCADAGIATHVLIRPRPGHFVLTPDEYGIVSRDIDVAKSSGAAGVVIGVLLADGSIDVATTERLIAQARPLFVTFHRAIDLTPSPIAALETLIDLGIDRVLTSGGPGLAREHRPMLRQMLEVAWGRVAVMAGGGVTLDDLPPLIHECNLTEFHIGSWVTNPPAGTTPFGSPPPIVDPARVARVVAALR